MAGASLPLRSSRGHPLTNAAFTTVTARRNLGFSAASTMTTPQPAPIQAKKIVEWPQPVREYVQRCFAAENNIPGITTEDVQARLKQIINAAAERDELGTTNWPLMLLPQQLLQQEKSSAMIAPQQNMIWESSVSGLQLQSPTFVNPSDNNLRKRKLNDDPTEPGSTTAMSTNPAPWQTTKPRNVFEDRISYPTPAEATKKPKEKKQKNYIGMTAELKRQLDPEASADLEKRRQRFESDRLLHSTYDPTRDDIPMSEANDGPVIGTCQTLEKNYFRLTAPPKPETVRPLPVLERTLEHLKSKWRKDNNYSYICDQFKSLRQDLTVQHVKNEFTVSVYELHARIALEKMDLGEYNQCQTQLRALYKQQLGGHPAEFLAYRILYFIYTCNRTDMNDVLSDLTQADREQPAVKHALDVRSAIAAGNYHRLFRLYLDTPHMGAYLMDMFIGRERLAAMASICRTYKPDVKLRFLTEELGFESDQDCAAFICDHGGQNLIDNKPDSGITLATGKAGQTFQAARDAAFRRVDIKGQI
jgi:hypothetical protein